MSLPTGTEIAKALTKSELGMPIKAIEPVGTYPTAAPPGAPEPTPQPVYQTANPNSFWGMNPMLAALAKFGFGGVVVFTLSVLLAWIVRSQSSAQSANDAAATATQKALLDSFAAVQKERSEEVKTLTQGILATQSGGCKRRFTDCRG